MPVDLDDLRVQVVTVLSWCEKIGLANQAQDLDDPETIEAYVLVLAANRIDSEILAAAKPRIFSEEFFPKPGTIIKHCESVRQRVLDQRQRAMERSMVPAVDDDGNTWMAVPCRVRHGRLLPPGDNSGDGSQTPKALPGETSDRGKALADQIVSREPRTTWGDEKRIRD